MPELPEVETVRGGLAPALEGALISRVEQRRADLRFPFPDNFAGRLEGQNVTRLSRRAKYLLAWLSGGEVLVMHLGMSGRFTVCRPATEPAYSEMLAARNVGAGTLPPLARITSSGNPAHDHVVFHLSDGTEIIYNDARRFGYMTLVAGGDLERHKLFAGLGVEPLGSDLTPDYLAGAASGRQTALKALLMDQKVIAGLGNIYVCEALHCARLSPRRSAAALATATGGPTARAARLTDAVKHVLKEAIKAGGSTLRDYQRADGSLGYFQHSFQVYGRENEACLSDGCSGRIRRIVQNGRSTFYCSACQR